jgi:chromosome partitioning protein
MLTARLRAIVTVIPELTGNVNMCETICLLNMKGGVGKTTLAANLAWHVSRHGEYRVLLLDFDPQFNASQYLMDYATYETHVKTKGTVADLLIDSPQLRLRKAKKKKSAKSCIAKIEEYSDGEGHLDLLPSELALSHVVKNPSQMDHRLHKLLEQLRPHYDYIFIDSAPTDSVLTTMALTASNYVLIPVRPDRYSLLGIANLLKTVEYFRENCNDPNGVRELGVVFTQIRKDSTIEAEIMKNIRVEAKRAGSHVFDAVLGYSGTFVRAVRDQTPAFETKFARDGLKANIKRIVAEMKQRIKELKGAEE